MRILLCITLFFMLPFWGVGEVYAQHYRVAKRNVTVSATIIDKIEMINVRDILLNGQKTIDGMMDVSPVNSSFAGMMRISGSPGRIVRITYLLQETLIEEGGNGGTINARYILSGNETDNQNASRILDNGEAVIQLGQDGLYYLWLGAKLDFNKAKPGSYASDFLIEMDSN